MPNVDVASVRFCDSCGRVSQGDHRRELRFEAQRLAVMAELRRAG